MFDDEYEKIPECLEIAAKMIGISVDKLETHHKCLFDKLLNIRYYLQRVKPYGELASTQVIASVVTNYFTEENIYNILSQKQNITYLDI